MIFLWNLVDDIARDLLSEWLGMVELGMLDTAMGNHSTRKWFTDQLQAVNIPLYRDLDTFYPTESLYEWMKCRNLRTSVLKPVKSDFENGFHYMSYFDVHFVKQVVFSRLYDHSALSAIVNACINLENLQCDDPVVFSLINSDILSGLLIINCNTVNKNCLWEDLVSALAAIEANCRALKIFEFTSDHYSTTVFDHIRNILNVNNALETLSLVFDSTIFDALHKDCPKLKSFRLTITKGLFPLRQATQLIKTKRLHYMQCVHRRTFEQLTYVDKQHSLELYNFEESFEEMKEALSDFSTLEKCTISFSLFTDGMQQAMVSNFAQTLVSLNLRCCKMACVLVLKSFQRLTSFAMELCQLSRDALQSCLLVEPLPLLQELSLGENSLSVSVVVQILSVYRTLTKCKFYRVTDDTTLYPQTRQQVKELIMCVPQCEVKFGGNNGLGCLTHNIGHYWCKNAPDFE